MSPLKPWHPENSKSGSTLTDFCIVTSPVCTGFWGALSLSLTHLLLLPHPPSSSPASPALHVLFPPLWGALPFLKPLPLLQGKGPPLPPSWRELSLKYQSLPFLNCGCLHSHFGIFFQAPMLTNCFPSVGFVSPARLWVLWEQSIFWNSSSSTMLCPW